MKFSTDSEQAASALAGALGFVHKALQTAKLGNVAPPPAIEIAAAVSWRTSCTRGSPCGDVHIASIAECAWSTSTSVSSLPQTLMPPAVAMMLPEMSGCVL